MCRKERLLRIVPRVSEWRAGGEAAFHPTEAVSQRRMERPVRLVPMVSEWRAGGEAALHPTEAVSQRRMEHSLRRPDVSEWRVGGEGASPCGGGVAVIEQRSSQDTTHDLTRGRSRQCIDYPYLADPEKRIELGFDERLHFLLYVNGVDVA